MSNIQMKGLLEQCVSLLATDTYTELNAKALDCARRALALVSTTAKEEVHSPAEKALPAFKSKNKAGRPKGFKPKKVSEKTQTKAPVSGVVVDDIDVVPETTGANVRRRGRKPVKKVALEATNAQST